MKKNIYTFLLFSVFVINFIFITPIGISFSNDDSPKYIFGKVVYEDNGGTVTEGSVNVFSINEITNQSIILETAAIDSTGEFKISIRPAQIEYGTKIMAYPNDYDNIEVPFQTKILDLKKNLTVNKKGEHSVLIKVNRVDNSSNNQSSKIYGKENGSLLRQNFPNPFNPTTLIRFELPQASNVTLKIYNMNGESVATLADNKILPGGLNEFEFDAGGLSSGIYIYSLTAGDYTETRKMTLLK